MKFGKNTVWLTIMMSLVTAVLVGSEIWSPEPAQNWNGFYPIGNGVMGAMVSGGRTTQLQFNHTRLWSGHPHCYDHEGAADALPELRELTFAGRKDEARDLANEKFFGIPLRQERFQPCGDVFIRFPDGDLTDFSRTLRLDEALHTTRFTLNGARLTQESFVPYGEDELIVHRIASDKTGAVACTIELSTPHQDATRCAKNGCLMIDGQVEAEGVRFAVRLAVTVKGNAATLTTQDERLVVTHADMVELRLVAATNLKNWKELAGDPAAACEATLKRVAARDYATLKKEHRQKFGALFGRVRLDLPGDAALAKLPTEERLARQSETHDPAFAKLVFDYGRYLLISSSRHDGEPSNLQGIWNKDLHPAWDSKYTCNINVEMNYWPVEPANLGDCLAPLTRAVQELAESGARTAKTHYNASGWVLHHNFDVWRGTAPVDGADWGLWQTGGAWMSLHLWEHWLFSQDKAYLNSVFPTLLGAAEFFTVSLVAHPTTGNLVTCPSLSPEHGGVVAGPAMDMQIVRALYTAVLDAAKIVGAEQNPVVAKVRAQLPRLEPDHIGKWGQLQEWIEDVDDPNDTHRHFSHLWAVYPGAAITTATPKLFEAAKVSMIARGDEATGWSMGWKINVWARLRDGDHAAKIMSNLFRPAITESGERGGLYPNLFDAHPPFQIDGNFGATAGIAEMLLQSHETDANGHPMIELLPALPSSWPNGRVVGLRARGDFTVALEWRDGQLVNAELCSGAGLPATVRCQGKVWTIKAAKGIITIN